MAAGRHSSLEPSNLRVLLVDDNRSGLAARRAVLDELGYRTAVADTPLRALAMLRDEHFDLLVTDYKMPDMDGIELISKVRTARPGLPVILLSGFVDALGITEKSSGADVVIMKSANEVPQLIRAAGRLLKLSRKPPASERPLKARRRASAV
jgi:CheY-like chemotaxis protein